ncbi:MAG: hypothetical protein IKB16_02220 [Lentisphaeria bacterium]|nr:hypothetical protein [Lentisphaeria bacterium]
MGKNKIFLWLFIALSALLYSGCRSDYSADAVERARDYALHNLRGITESQRAFIKFTQPEIYENLIFPQVVTPVDEIGHVKKEDYKDFPLAPYLDLMHCSIVWAPPDLNAKIVVVGDGQRNMHNWSPRRVLIKNYIPADPGFTAAVTACQVHVKDNMLYLSTAERNRIRFSDPAEIAFTKIDIALPHVKEKAGKSDWELYLMELKESKKEYTQISLIWNGDKADQKIVFTGLTTTGSLAGWKFQTAELMSVAKLNKNRMTQAEIRKIKVVPAKPLKQIHPAAPEIKRTNPQTSPDAPEQGGSIIYHK